VNPPVLKPFSSSGTTPILFNTAGTGLGTAAPGEQPQIVAPDGGGTTFFDIDVDGNGFPNFFGTSAAAPQAPAVAALILQSVPTMPPAQVLATLQSTARE
jgi:subtilisin family serine protease